MAIGSCLGSVLDVDVIETGVQWGKCLCVRVKIDVTKRLVRGKKISSEGGEPKWVNFRYERLPNFCYRCGLLSHSLKECSEGRIPGDKDGESQLQYGAWLRGEPLRRGGKEVFTQGARRNTGDRIELAEGSPSVSPEQ